MNDVSIYLTTQAQANLNKVLECKNTMVYAINVDGSIMELQQGCTLLTMNRYQMETYFGGKAK